METKKIVIAPDSFKGTMSAAEVAEAIAKGFRDAFTPSTFELCLVPMADGGEGTVDAWASAVGARLFECRVRDPLGRPISAAYAYKDSMKTAVIEMSAASGLPLLKAEERDPLRASTFGTGELIADAIKRGAKKILLGLGGSATNDGGTGMLRALGAKFFGGDGRELPEGGAALANLARIEWRGVGGVKFEAACDVTNPLCGVRGASAVYGPQKGASPAAVALLDGALAHFAKVAAPLPESVAGDGAAGGMGFAVRAFLGGELRRGVEMIGASVGLAEKVRGAALVITGEGRTDAQTAAGKTPVGVAAFARGVPVIDICGARGDGWEEVLACGISEVIAANPRAGVLASAQDIYALALDIAREKC